MGSGNEFSFSEGRIKIELPNGVSFEGLVRDCCLDLANNSLSMGILGDSQNAQITMVPEISFSCTLSYITLQDKEDKAPKSLMRLIRV